MSEHKPVNWFTRGVYPSCSCGYSPRDNAALNLHWNFHDAEYVDRQGTVVNTMQEKR